MSGNNPSGGLKNSFSGSENFAQLKLRYLELTSLFEINKILNSTLDLRSILDNVLRTPMGRLMISRGMVLLRLRENVFVVRNVKGLPTQLLGREFSLPVLPDHAVSVKELESGERSLLLEELQKQQLEIIVPLIAEEKFLGMLAFGPKLSGEPFAASELEFLESIGNLAAVAVEKALLFSELKDSYKRLDRKIQQMNTLIEIGKELNATLDPHQIAQILSFAIMGELMLNKCVVVLEYSGELRVEVKKGLGGGLTDESFQRCRETLTDWFREGNAVIVLKEVAVPPEMTELCSRLHEAGIHYLIPLVTKGKIRGLVGVGNKVNGGGLNEEEMEFLAALANEAVIGIENAFLVQEMLEKQRMEEELKIARDIQNLLLPQKIPSIPGVEISALNIPSREVGGDYYDCIRLANGLYGIAIADVSGKSMPAALLMANLQASLHALAIDHTDVRETVAHINQIIHENTAPDKFITFFYGVLNPQTRELTYCNAGHNPPILLRNGGEMMELKKGGLILGLLPDAAYEAEKVPLSSGDLILCYTDGVTEAQNGAEEEFGEERLKEILRNVRGLGVEDLLARIAREVSAFSQGRLQYDDITLLALRIL